MDPLDPAWIDSLSQAQEAGARLIAAAARRLERGMSGADIRSLVGQLADEARLELLEPARITLGPRSARLPPLLSTRLRLLEATLVSIDVRVRVAQVAGDYARTVRFDDQGRMWFYQRIADRIYAAFVAGLGGCGTERDALELARHCASREGCQLVAPGSSIGHHLQAPLPDPPPGPLARRHERIEHLVRAAVPFGLASPKLAGLWSLEPCFEVDRHQYLYEDAFLFAGGEVRLIGPPLPDAKG
jgi:hypothetical protein